MLNIDHPVSLPDASGPRSLNSPAVSEARCLRAGPLVCAPHGQPLPSVAGRSPLTSPLPAAKDGRRHSLPPPCALYPCTISRTDCMGPCSCDRMSVCSRPWDRPHPCNG